jgi:hypothetical protein
MGLLKQINKKAFSSVEVLLSVALFGLIAISLSSGLAYVVSNGKVIEMQGKALLLAEEGLEAVYSMRQIDYTGLTDGTYGLDVVDNKWALVAQPEIIEGDYERTITISSVLGDSKKIESKVSWNTPQPKSVTLDLYVSDWSFFAGWQNPQVVGTSFVGERMNEIMYNEELYLLSDSEDRTYLFNVDNPENPYLANQVYIEDPVSIDSIGHTPSRNYYYIYIGTSNRNAEVHKYLTYEYSGGGYYLWGLGDFNLDRRQEVTAIECIDNDICAIGRSRHRRVSELSIIEFSWWGNYNELWAESLDEDVIDILVKGDYMAVITEPRGSSNNIYLYDIGNMYNPNLLDTYELRINRDIVGSELLNSDIYIASDRGEIEKVVVESNRLSSEMIYSSSQSFMDFDLSSEYIFLATSTKQEELLILENSSNVSKLGSLSVQDGIELLTYDEEKDSIYAYTDKGGDLIVIQPDE